MATTKKKNVSTTISKLGLKTGDIRENLKHVAKVLSELDFKPADRKAVDEIVTLFNEGKLSVVENPVESTSGTTVPSTRMIFEFDESGDTLFFDIKDEQAKKISDLLTIEGKSLIEKDDVKDAGKLLLAINEYVKVTSGAIELLQAAEERESSSKEPLRRKIGELEATIRKLEDQRTALQSRVIKAEKSNTGLKVISGIAIGANFLGLGAMAATHYAWSQDKEAYAQVEGLFNESEGSLYDKVSAILGINADLLEKLQFADSELAQIIEVLSQYNVDVNNLDTSDALSMILEDLKNQNNSITPEDGVNQGHVNAVYDALAAALGVDPENLKIDGVYNEVLIDSAVNAAIEEAKNSVPSDEDGVNQSHVDAVYVAIENALGLEEGSLKDNSGVYNEELISTAIDAAIDEAKNSITPEDGVNQSHVDAAVNEVYNTIINVFKNLGITEESFKVQDESGNYYFSTEKLSSELAYLVENFIAESARLTSVENKVDAILNQMQKDDSSEFYDLDDFDSIEDACDFIEDRLRILNADLTGLKNDYASALRDLETTKRQVQSLEKEIQALQDKNSQNSAQTGSSANNGSTSSGSPVGDREPDSESNPNQGNKTEVTEPDDFEPGC